MFYPARRVGMWTASNSIFERPYENTVVEMDNKDVDPKIVSDSLEVWLAKQVKVTSTATDTGAGRVIRYTTGQISGELHYTIKPLPDATLTVNSASSRGNFQSLDIQIVEQGTN